MNKVCPVTIERVSRTSTMREQPTVHDMTAFTGNRLLSMQSSDYDYDYGNVENLRIELKDAVDARIQLVTNLNAKLRELTSERDELRKVMIVGQLATATQFALTEQFSGAFMKTKFSYSCTFDDIKARVLMTGDVNHETKLNEAIAMFEASGIDETDISSQLNVIREIGTRNSHPTTMISSDQTEYVPTPEQLLELIENTNLQENIKDTAKTLVGILQQLHPPGTLNVLVIFCEMK